MDEFSIVTRRSTDLLLSVVFCCPVALWFLRAPFRSRRAAGVIFLPHHRSITSPTEQIARFLVVTPMSVAKTFSRTAREGAGPCPAVVCGDASHYREACVQSDRHFVFIAGVGVDMKLFS